MSNLKKEKIVLINRVSWEEFLRRSTSFGKFFNWDRDLSLPQKRELYERGNAKKN
ncbi:MAG: hypothetical protein HND50_01680 [Calditrichaeota bacterium]|nr:hypothetical protein [Calditrichota bacterium]